MPPRARILVVEDDVDAALALGTLLELDGHDIRLAHNGRDGFESARTFQPHIAILDLNMPEPNGLELAQLIRQQPWGAGLCLIALTGQTEPNIRSRAALHGFDLFLGKPMDPAAFEAIIHRESTRIAAMPHA